MIASVHSPSEYYIKYLLSESGLEEKESIRTHLSQLGLDYRSHVYLSTLYDTMLPLPEPYMPEDPKHYKTTKWLRDHRIHDMWRSTPAVQEAQLILNDLSLREHLHPLLLSNLPPTDVIRQVRRHTRLRLTRQSVLVYAHYFWNRQVMGQREWIRYLSGMSEGSAMQAGLTLAPDMMRDHLPHIMGLSGPPAWQGPDAIVRVAQIAFSKVLQTEHMPPSVNDSRMLKNYMEVMFRADEIMQRSGSAIQEVLKAFQSFRMRTDDRKVIDIDQLSGGNYTGSGVGTGSDE